MVFFGSTLFILYTELCYNVYLYYIYKVFNKMNQTIISNNLMNYYITKKISQLHK